MSDDLLEQARQHVASFEAIGGTGAYPFSVRLAKRVIALSEVQQLRVPATKQAADVATEEQDNAASSTRCTPSPYRERE
jgi:hypothetical protein